MKKIAEHLADGRTLVSDGAWGTFLYEKGLAPGECPELWCVEHRGDVLEVARSYVDAGSHVIQANSFGGSRYKLDMFGLGDRVHELNECAAQISREAAGPDRNILASVGPTGKMLMMGDVTREDLYLAFKDQLVALEAGGADACCIETMIDVDEAVEAIRAAREHTGLEIACTFTFERSAIGEYRTMMGASPTDVAKALVEAGSDIIGTNCGNGIEGMIPIVEEMRRAAPGKPILVQANAGIPTRENGEDVFPDTPAEMAKQVPAIVDAGAAIIGGCCGTTPDHIRAMRQATEGLS